MSSVETNAVAAEPVNNNDADDDDDVVPEPMLPLRHFQLPGVSLTLRAFEQLPPSDAVALLTGEDNTGMMVWRGSHRLAAHICAAAAQEAVSNAPLVIVELGCGAGLLGIAAAIALTRGEGETRRPCTLVLTDGNPACVDLARQNFVLNAEQLGQHVKCVARPLLWGDGGAAASLLRSVSASPAGELVILAADVIYSAAVVGPLALTVLEIGDSAAQRAATFYFTFYPRCFSRAQNVEVLSRFKQIILTHREAPHQRNWTLAEELELDEAREQECNSDLAGALLKFVLV
jgi:hypothetical protein